MSTISSINNYGTGAATVQSIDVITKRLLDNRCIVEKATELDNISTSIRPNGLLVWCQEDRKLYAYDEPNLKWQRVGTLVIPNPEINSETLNVTSLQIDESVYKIGILNHDIDLGESATITDFKTFLQTLYAKTGAGGAIVTMQNSCTINNVNGADLTINKGDKLYVNLIDVETGGCSGFCIGADTYFLFNWYSGEDTPVVNVLQNSNTLNTQYLNTDQITPYTNRDKEYQTSKITLEKNESTAAVGIATTGTGSNASIDISSNTSKNSQVAVNAGRFTFNGSHVITQSLLHKLTITHGDTTLCEYNTWGTDVKLDLSGYMKGSLDSDTGILTITL